VSIMPGLFAVFPGFQDRLRRRAGFDCPAPPHRAVSSAGRMRWRFISAVAQPGPMVSSAFAATAIRGAIRTGRLRAAVTIQSAAYCGVSAGIPWYSFVGAIIGVVTSG
jgi:hypothetical protein